MEDVMSFPRQTGLTFEQISEMLDSGISNYPRCLLINELGIIAQENKNAEVKLRGLLFTEKRDNEKCGAYGFLSRIKEPDPETVQAIEQFRANPENNGIVRFADEKNATT